MDKHSDQSIMDKSMRSVFVGNIPYEATEEKLKEIFNEVGPVLSLKLVYDRESGKPKGYGFCEYKDQETALSAMRNLNGYEIGGRTLRVDNACTEKSRMEMQQLLQGPQVENPYGDQCDPEQAPEAITKTVASLPPEQMYELMKQMKACIQNNPSEARQMLLQNPQLAYALLQAQVVMRIVDPQTAVTMLHKANQMPPVLHANMGFPGNNMGNNNMNHPGNSMNHPGNSMNHPGNNMNHPGNNINHPGNNMNHPGNSMAHPGLDMNMMSAGPVPMPVPAPLPVPPVNFPQQGQDVDLRNTIDPRMARSMDQDMRGGPPMDPGYPPPRNIPPPQQQQQQQQPRPNPVAPPFQSDPRQRNIDPRVKQQQPQHQGPPPPVGVSIPQQQPPQTMQQPPPSAPAVQAAPSNRLAAGGIPNNASDQEKAALIMQVLQLSDEQISMLPPEQRASILVLKEQIAKSTQR